MKYALIGITMVVALFLIIVVVAQESKQPGMGSAIGGGAEGMMGGNPAVKMPSFRNLPLCSVFYSPCFVLCSGGI